MKAGGDKLTAGLQRRELVVILQVRKGKSRREGRKTGGCEG
jgi:hypothetical protein